MKPLFLIILNRAANPNAITISQLLGFATLFPAYKCTALSAPISTFPRKCADRLRGQHFVKCGTLWLNGVYIAVFIRRLRVITPTMPKPASSMAQVSGSGMGPRW